MDSKETLFSLYEKAICQPNIEQREAVVFHDGSAISTITYAKMNGYVNDISNCLKSLSASEEVICCFVGPGLNLPALLLSILKVNSAFTVLGKDDPNRHLSILMKFLSIRTIIAEEKLSKIAKLNLCECWTSCRSFLVGLDNMMVFRKVKSYCQKPTHMNNSVEGSPRCHPGIAFVIQTSGTTGCPKVVQVPHQCIVPNIIHFRSLYGTKEADKVFLGSPLTFDPSIIDIFLALSSGACLIITPDHLRLMPQKLGEVLLTCEVTILQITPSLLLTLNKAFAQEKLLGKETHLRVLALGGESFPSCKALRSLIHPGNETTRLFNLYGLTEVSCWATCHEMSATFLKEYEGRIPLGKPLLDTTIDVRDESGRSLEEGCGQLFVGGSRRWCILNDEALEMCSSIRATGDWVYRQRNGDLLYRGRKDCLIKFHGKKFSVLDVEKLLEGILEVSQHVVFFEEKEPILYIFIVINPDYIEKACEVKCSVDKIIVSKATSLNVPVFETVSVPHIPTTAHGKTDIRKLLKYAKKHEGGSLNLQKAWSNDMIISCVSSVWKDLIGVESINSDDNFVLCGGNSISALQLVHEIENKIGFLCPELLDRVLNSSLKDVVELVKVKCLHQTNIPLSKRPKTTDEHTCDESSGQFINVQSLMTKLCHRDAHRRGFSLFCYCDKCSHERYHEVKNLHCGFCEYFKYDMKKCVDSSPCVSYFPHRSLAICFIGSHSGQFSAVDIKRKEMLWQAQLPDRIESSPCLSECGRFVFVGCYDHHLYCFQSQTGILHWKLKTRAEVKCSPFASGSKVYVGSHDQNLYAVEVESGKTVWQKKLANGSIFSSPAVSLGSLCSATLDGTLQLMSAHDGSTIWRCEYRKPFFSSPIFVNSSIFIGCVDGCLLKYDQLGNLVGKYITDGPIFSSPTLVPANPSRDGRIIIGSHDGRVYCYSLSGEQFWTFKSDSSIYATPFVFATGKDSFRVIVASTKGMISILDAENGTLMQSLSCPGEVFSSPAMLDNYLVVGCRDNNVYFYKNAST